MLFTDFISSLMLVGLTASYMVVKLGEGSII